MKFKIMHTALWFTVYTMLFVATAGAQCPSGYNQISTKNCYKDNQNMQKQLFVKGNVGIGTTSPLGKLTVEDTAHSLTWGYVYNPLLMENTYGNFVRDGAHIYGSINQNPTGGEHYQGMFSIDTTTGAGVQLFVNYSGSEDWHEIILRNDNPADTSKNIVLTVSDTGIVVSNPLTFAPFFKIDGTGQMRYYKSPFLGAVLGSDASGNATWQAGGGVNVVSGADTITLTGIGRYTNTRNGSVAVSSVPLSTNTTVGAWYLFMNEGSNNYQIDADNTLDFYVATTLVATLNIAPGESKYFYNTGINWFVR